MSKYHRALMLGNLLPYESMQDLVFEFERLLRQYDVEIQSDSDLERVCLAIMDILAKKKHPELLHPLEDVRTYFAGVLGLWVFMNKLVRLEKHADFQELIPHFVLLNEGGVPQNARSPVSDQASDKLFELLFALICMEKGTHVRLDNPNSSKGDNPDVLATILGQRWGFACKTMYSTSPKTMFDRICEGLDQIDNSEAEIGCVVINFRNLIDHDRAWPILNEEEVRNGDVPIFGCPLDPSIIGRDLALLACRKQAEIEASVGKDVIQATFQGRKSVSGYLTYLQTSAGIVLPVGPIPSSVGALFLAQFGDVSRHLRVFELLNSAMHRML